MKTGTGKALWPSAATLAVDGSLAERWRGTSERWLSARSLSQVGALSAVAGLATRIAEQRRREQTLRPWVTKPLIDNPPK